jgi:hypothetical protein
MEPLRRYNQNPQFAKSLIQKALTAANASGGPLTPQILERLITNMMVRLAAEIAMIVPKQVAGKYAEFNRVTALPAAHGTIGDGGTTPVRQSTYVRTGRNLKVIRRKGAVTVFLQDASRDYIDVVAQEMENHLQAHVFDLNTYNVFGSELADPYMPNGLDHLIGGGGFANRVQQVYGGAVPASLKFLDDMIDSNTRKQGQRHRKAILMSPEMLSLVSRILSNVRLVQNQTGSGLSTIEINGGWRLQAYRNVPIIESALCRPQAKMGAVTATPVAGASASGLGGATTLYFQVSAITWDGETEACTEVSQAITTEDRITLAWTAVAGAFMYKIYVSNTAGGGATTELLKLVIPSQLYDANGTPCDQVVSVTLSTNPATANPTIYSMDSALVGAAAAGGGIVPTITASVPTHLQLDRPLVATGGVVPENVFFWDLDEIQGMGRFAYTNTEGSRFRGLATMEPLAKTDDNLPFMVKTYGCLIDAFEGTCFQNRGLRIA